jgi:hypothetical protein
MKIINWNSKILKRKEPNLIVHMLQGSGREVNKNKP